MLKLSGFSECTLLFEEKPYSVFRALKEPDGERVLIRTKVSEEKRLADLAGIRKNFKISQQIRNTSKIDVLKYIIQGGDFFEVLKDEDYIPLNLYLQQSESALVNTENSVDVLIEMAHSLKEIHSENLFHLGVNPSSIYVHSESKKIKFTGFSQSIYSHAAISNYSGVGIPLNMMHFISPEHTGKINKAVDNRSDLYSLGMVFYYILTGRKAFEIEDPYELIYAHLARSADPLKQISPKISENLSDLVHKLIAKDPSDRYQSSHGLLHDLLEIKKGRKLTVLGQLDISDQFIVQAKNYGRSAIFNQIAELSSGKDSKLILIQGPDGIGKSFFLRELRKWFSKNQKQVSFHRCDPSTKDIPLSTIAGLVNGILDELFTLSQSEIESWKLKLKSAVKADGNLLSQVVPQLEWFIGNDTAGISATLQEEEERFDRALTSIFKTFIESGILFLVEDLENCDSSSSDFLISLLNSNQKTDTFLIASTLPDGGTNSWQSLQKEERISGSVHQFALEPLKREDISEILSDSMSLPIVEVSELAEIIRNKTGGIPKYLISLLRKLGTDNHLKFDYDLNRWTWDSHSIGQMPEQEDVAEIIYGRVKTLSKPCKQLIKYASCIGLEFDVNIISAISDIDKISVIDILSEAVDEDIIKLMDHTPADVDSEGIMYAFTLLGVHKDVYKNLKDDFRERSHLEIGNWILDNVSEDFDNVFEIANHVNIGFSLITVASDNRKYLDLFYSAGILAKSSLSYSLAFRYLSNAKELIRTNDWTSDYDRMFQLLLELVETAYLANKENIAQNHFDEALRWSRSNVDKAKLYLVKARIQVHLSDLSGSFDSGIAGLNYLGISIPRSPGTARVGIEILKSIVALRGKSFDDILELPDVSDPKSIIAQDIYYILLSYSQEIPELYSLIALRMMRLTLKKGIHPHSFSGFTVYGSVLSIAFGKIEKGFEFMEFADKIASRSDSLSSKAGARFGLGMQGVYKRSLNECIEYFNQAHQLADQAGAKFYASTATNHLLIYHFIIGQGLEDLSEKTTEYLQYAYDANEKATIVMLEFANTFIRSLKTDSLTEGNELLAEFQSEEEMIPILWTWHHILRQGYYCLIGDYDNSLQAAREAESKIDSTTFHLMFYYHVFFKMYAYARTYSTLEPTEKKRAVKFLRKHLKKLKKLARYSEDIFKPLLLYAEGLLAKIEDDSRLAVDKLNSSVQLMGDIYTWQKAMILEIIAQTERGSGQREKYQQSIALSFQLFRAWGSNLKCKLLLEEYPQELRELKPSNLVDSDLDWEVKGNNDDIETNAELFNVVESLQSLSSEIELDKFLSSLMTIGMKYAGAERGAVVIYSRNKPKVEIQAKTDSNELKTSFASEAPTSESFPLTILNYVYQTGKSLIIQDALTSDRFESDPFVIDMKPKSILVIPLKRDKEILGLLYFENRLTSGAFTNEKLDIIQLLANQAGISLQNARLYADVISLNKAYQRFVPLQFLDLLEKESVVDLELGMAKDRDMSVLFCDIRGFTTLSEKLGPQESFNFLNEYLGVMEPIISEHNGFIDKYMGDGILALFPFKADNAVNCCLKLSEKLREFNKIKEHPIEMGMGLNSGPLMLGIVGARNRMEGTVISDVVNVAARIEKLTKKYSVDLIITQDTVYRLQDPDQFRIKSLGKVEAEGRSEMLNIYSVTSSTEALPSD